MGRKPTRGRVCHEGLMDLGLSSTRIERAQCDTKRAFCASSRSWNPRVAEPQPGLPVPGLKEDVVVIGGGTVFGYQACATPRIRNIS
jgi:hypothetical protein